MRLQDPPTLAQGYYTTHMDVIQPTATAHTGLETLIQTEPHGDHAQFAVKRSCEQGPRTHGPNATIWSDQPNVGSLAWPRAKWNNLAPGPSLL